MKKKVLSLALAAVLVIFVLPNGYSSASDSVSPELGPSVVVNNNNVFVIKADGSLWGWGDNLNGQVGNGKNSSDYPDRYFDYYEKTPQKILDNVASVEVCNTSAMALKTDGSLWSWGTNSFSENMTGLIDSPVPVKIMEDVTSFCFYGTSGMAIKSDGSLWGWGFNLHGEVGDGTVERRYKPVKIMDNVASVSPVRCGFFAIKTDGSLWGWGGMGYLTTTLSSYMILGNGTDDVGSLVPVKIMENVRSFHNVADVYMAIKTDGSLWSWGKSIHGAIGAEPGTIYYSPIKIMDDVAGVSLNFNETAYAVKTDGSLWRWGYAFLPDYYDTYINYWTPDKISDGVAAVSEYSKRSCAVKTDGSLWTWGYNYYGELGDSTTTDRAAPVKIIDSGVVSAVVGSDCTYAVKQDGSLWSWGFNNYGLLGNGTWGEGSYLAVQKTPLKIMDGVRLPNGASAPAPSGKTVNPTASTVYVDGAKTDFDAYTIDGNNYFKLRDLAKVLNGTAKQFEVGYNNDTKAITLTSGMEYTFVGGEMAKGDGKAKNAVPTASKIYLDGAELSLTVYTINGNNFFKLRDLMQAIDVYVGYDNATKNITLDTSKGYVD